VEAHVVTEVLREEQTEVQRLLLARTEANGVVLFLDGAEQFAERTEHVYHEGLAVVPMLLGQARRIFIGGGGDGLLLARVLRFEGVEHVTLCDLDPAVTALARSAPELLALNSGSLDDSRVRLVHADARAWLAGSVESFDLILFDFPCPHAEVLTQLYTREMYAIAHARLVPGGILATSCLPSAGCFAHASATLGAVFRHVRPYRLRMPDGAAVGFALASDSPPQRLRGAPAWTRHVGDALADACFAFGKDEAAPAVAPSTDAAPHFAWRWTLDEHRIVLDPCHYAPEHRVLNLAPETEPAVVEQVVRAALATHPRVLAYVPEQLAGLAEAELLRRGYRRKREYFAMSYPFTDETRGRLRELWEQYSNDSVCELDATSAPTASDPELASLFEGYLAQNAERYLDVPRTAPGTHRTLLHLVARKPDGAPAALMLLAPATWLVEVLYGVGSSRQNMLGLLLQLQYLHCQEPRVANQLRFAAATDNIASVMARLGAGTDYVMQVWVPAE
jgi:spermidine synthase